MDGGRENILSPFVLQRIPKEVPKNSFSRGHVGKKIGDSLEMPPRKEQRILRDLPSLRPHPPQRTGVADAEEYVGPKLGPAKRKYLRRYFPEKSIPGAVQRTATRIDATTLMKHLEAGALEQPGPCR
jgi:hypothetical protein